MHEPARCREGLRIHFHAAAMTAAETSSRAEWSPCMVAMRMRV